MFPTSTLPIAPLLAPAGIGALLGIVTLGAFLALIVGLVLHRREHERETAIEVAETVTAIRATEAPSRTRLSA